MVSIQTVLVPLLISRQFHGVNKTFGRKAADNKELIDKVLGLPVARSSRGANSNSILPPVIEYAVQAHVQKACALRARSVAAYLYACQELANKAAVVPVSKNPCLFVPPGTSPKPKFHSMLLPVTALAPDAKVTIKSCLIGRNCQIGFKCRLNCVLLNDGVKVGDNAVMQITVVGHDAVIGENCNLNECQVAPKVTLQPQTKQKGESFLID